MLWKKKPKTKIQELESMLLYDFLNHPEDWEQQPYNKYHWFSRKIGISFHILVHNETVNGRQFERCDKTVVIITTEPGGGGDKLELSNNFATAIFADIKKKKKLEEFNKKELEKLKEQQRIHNVQDKLWEKLQKRAGDMTGLIQGKTNQNVKTFDPTFKAKVLPPPPGPMPFSQYR